MIENKLNSVEGIDMGEDTVLMHRLFFYVHKVVHLPMAFVHYVRYNSNSYCWNMSRKSLCDMLAGEKILVDFYSRFITTDNNIRAVVYRLRMQNQIPLCCIAKGNYKKMEFIVFRYKDDRHSKILSFRGWNHNIVTC